MMLQTLKLTCCALLFSQIAVAEQTSLGANLNDLLAYAQQHNPDLAVRQAETLAAQARIQAVSEFPDPSFEYERMDVSQANTGMSSNRFRLAQTLPYWGKLNLRAELANSEAKEREQAWELQWQELASQIKNSYAIYYRAHRQLEIIDRNLALLNSLQLQAESRYGVGLLPQQDTILLYSEITSLKVERLEIERQLKSTAAQLNSLLPRSANAVLAKPEALAPLKSWPDLETLFAQAKQQTPQFNMQRQALTSAEKNRQLTQLEQIPDFNVAIRNNRPETGNSSWDVMVAVDLPIRKVGRSAQQREAEANLEANRQQLLATEVRINGQLGALLADLQASRDKIDLLKNTLLPQIQANLAAAQVGYATGKVSFNMVIDASIKILRTEVELLNTEVNARLQQAELEKLSGENSS